MPRHYRIHAIAITIICLVIIGVYFLTRPKPIPAIVSQPQLGDRYIQIFSATWGEECNPYIEHNAANMSMKKDENGMLIVPERPTPVEVNNVLPALSKACNRKLSCNLFVNSNNLNAEPMESCFKQLKVSYRCFAFDRLWSVTAQQGGTLHIDCNETAQQPSQ